MQLLYRRLLIAIFICFTVMNLSMHTFHLGRRHKSLHHTARNVTNAEKEETNVFLSNLKDLFSMSTASNINDIMWRVASLSKANFLGPVSGVLTFVIQISGYEDETKKLLKEIKNDIKRLENIVQSNHNDVMKTLNAVPNYVKFNTDMERVEDMVDFFLNSNENVDKRTKDQNMDDIFKNYAELKDFLESLGGTNRLYQVLDLNKYGLNEVTIATIIANHDDGGTEKLKMVIKDCMFLAFFGSISYETAKLYKGIRRDDQIFQKLLRASQKTTELLTNLQNNRINLAFNWIGKYSINIVKWAEPTSSEVLKDLTQRIMNKLFTKFQVKSCVFCTTYDYYGRSYTGPGMISLYFNEKDAWCYINLENIYDWGKSKSLKNSIAKEVEQNLGCIRINFQGQHGFCIDRYSDNGAYPYNAYSSNMEGPVFEWVKYQIDGNFGMKVDYYAAVFASSLK